MPHREVRVPVMRPRAPQAESILPRLRAIDASGWFTNFGPQEVELRSRFADRLHVHPEQVALAGNATLAISGSVAVLGGRRWLVPGFTFAATPAAVLTAGAEVVLGDVHVGSLALDSTDAPAYDGVVPVAPFGAAPDVSGWSDAGRVVHDAAASLGCSLHLGALPAGQAVVFSLHATKVLGAGEGGVVVFGDPEDAEKFRAWTNFGLSGSRDAQFAGTNAKMSELQAAYAHAALDGWEQERSEWACARTESSSMLLRSGLGLFEASRVGINPYAIAVLPDAASTDRIERLLAVHDIETRRWWSRGCHRMPAFQHLAAQPLPGVEAAAATTIGFPFFRGITSDEIAAVETALASASVVRDA